MFLKFSGNSQAFVAQEKIEGYKAWKRGQVYLPTRIKALILFSNGIVILVLGIIT